MAKVVLDADIESISGKLSKKKTAMYCTNKQTGKCYRVEYNPDRKASNSTKQQAVKTKFRSKAVAASTWWKANKEVKGTDGTITKQATDDMKALLVAYKNQNRYGNPYCYLRSLITDDLKVTIGGVTKQITVSGVSGGSGGNEEEL